MLLMKQKQTACGKSKLLPKDDKLMDVSTIRLFSPILLFFCNRIFAAPIMLFSLAHVRFSPSGLVA
jgi:hypothetical protein